MGDEEGVPEISAEELAGLNMPPEHSIAGMAIYQHEWFTSWMRAGFTRAEALHLLKHQMFVQAHMSLHGDGEDNDSADA